MSLIHSNEEVLIINLKKGKTFAYNYLVDYYGPILFAFALSKCRDEFIAADIVQNVFLKLWKGRQQIVIKKSLKSYLYKMTQNEFVKHIDKNKTRSTVEKYYAEAINEYMVDFDEESLKNITVNVHQEISKLPGKCREVFMLSRKEGLTNLEIAAYLKISVKTVEGHITKAFNLLKKRLKDTM